MVESTRTGSRRQQSAGRRSRRPAQASLWAKHSNSELSSSTSIYDPAVAAEAAALAVDVAHAAMAKFATSQSADEFAEEADPLASAKPVSLTENLLSTDDKDAVRRRARARALISATAYNFPRHKTQGPQLP